MSHKATETFDGVDGHTREDNKVAATMLLVTAANRLVMVTSEEDPEVEEDRNPFM